MDEKTSRDTDLETETMQQNELVQTKELATGILEQVDLSTLQIIHKLFTGPGNGPAFLARILCFAEVKQMAFPGIEGTTDVAVITLKTIRELAKKIHWGYDTTHKYVVVFCALNLLVKSRSEGRIQLLFSLKQYTPPPTSKALDDLISKSRPKVRQFATRVKHRCILYDIIQHEETKQEGHSTLEQQLLQQLQSILQAEHINQAQRQRLTMRISSEILSKLILPSSAVENILPQSGPSSEQGKTSNNVPAHIVDSFIPDSGFEQKTLTRESTPAQADIVISDKPGVSEREIRAVPVPLPRVDSSDSKPSSSQNSGVDSRIPKQSSVPAEHLAIKSTAAEKSTKPAKPAKNTGDSVQEEVDFSAITQINVVNYSESFLRAYVTFNVIDFINKNYNKDVNVTSRTELAKFLAEIMDNDCEKWKIHMKLLNSCHPDVIAGALIQVFSRIYDRGGDSIRNRAGLFTRYCKDFQAEVVPPNVVSLANSLKDKTFEQMIAFFRYRQQKVEPERSVEAKQTQQSVLPQQTQQQSHPSGQTQQQATASSIYGLKPGDRYGEVLARQGNRIIVKKYDYGEFAAKKRRATQGY